MTESPTLLLQRAAELITSRSLHFLAYQVHFTPGASRFESPEESWAYDALDRNASQAQKKWVETFNPLLAPAFVELLEDAARRAEKHDHLSPEGSTYQRCALELARAVLGVSAEGKERSDP